MRTKLTLLILSACLILVSCGNNEPKDDENTRTFSIDNVKFRMKRVEKGTFSMGATSEMENPWDEEKPVHTVNITHDYWMGETEVTQALWETVMGKNPSEFKDPQIPVNNINWDDCHAFISKLNEQTGMKFRLPTEAEWEFAARGGNLSNHTQYSGSANAEEVAWCNTDEPEAVATKKPNELGIYDMTGNMWEWCEDYSGDYSAEIQTNPTGPASGYDRIYRGGGFNVRAWYGHISYRGFAAPSKKQNDLGLRLALTLEE